MVWAVFMRKKDPRVFAGMMLCALLWGCDSGNQLVQAEPPATPPPSQVSQNITVPSAALMKSPVTRPDGSTAYVFNSLVMLAPPTAGSASPSPDASIAIQQAIDAIASANLSKGGVIFLAPGTYLLRHTLKLEGTGVTLVGVRAATQDGATGDYPTLEYDDSLVDVDYETGSTTTATLDRPAAVRFNGNADYSGTASYSYGGLIGVNITYTGNTGSGSEGDKATGLATYMPHQVLFRDVTINNTYRGLDVGPCTSPYFHHITINNFRGDFGSRFGQGAVTAFKIHALTMSAAPANTTATDIIVPQNGEVIGADITGGGIGIDISGTSASLADDIFLRSIDIHSPSQQGIVVGYARSVYLNDIAVDHAGAESLKVIPGFLGELAVTGFQSMFSGLSAVRVQQGMNIDFANVSLVGSGQAKSSATLADLPIAGISIDSSVTSFRVTGAKIGDSNGQTVHEDWGVYVSQTPPLYAPWHTPGILASAIEFPNIPTAQHASGVTVSNATTYDVLQANGYFNAPLEDSWLLQALATDPVFPGALGIVKGFNSYDLLELRDRQWIDLTSSALSSAAVVDSFGNLNPTNFAYWEGIAATQFPEGFVMYLPSGRFNTSFTSYTRRIYNLGGTLAITAPGVQLVGDGRSVTQIYNTIATPNVSLVELSAGSTGSGVFGLSLIYDKTAALAAPGTPTSYAPPFLVTNTSQVRLANLGVNYSLGGGVAIVDTTNSELFDTDMNHVGGNNSEPAGPLGIYTLTATTNESTADIRFYETFGEFLENIWASGATAPCSSNDACLLTPAQIPDFEWVRVVGGVTRFRIDSSTFIEGKRGYATESNSGGTPHELSSFKWATDHVYNWGVDLQQAAGMVDFVEPWMDAREGLDSIGSSVTANVRISAAETRFGSYEGVLLQGSGQVALVNDHIGQNSLLASPYTQVRPRSGVFLGNPAGSVVFVGGVDGWLSNTNASTPTVNSNQQNWGLVLGTGVPATQYQIIGTDLYGNQIGRVGQQTSGINGTTLVP
jgi:hypothetical protein